MSKMTEAEKLDLALVVAKHVGESAEDMTKDMGIIITALTHALAVAGVNSADDKKEFISYVVHVIDEVYDFTEERKKHNDDR